MPLPTTHLSPIAIPCYFQINLLFGWARPQYLQQPLGSHRYRQAPYGEQCLWISSQQTSHVTKWVYKPRYISRQRWSHTLFPSSSLLPAKYRSVSKTCKKGHPLVDLVGLILLENPTHHAVCPWCWDLNSTKSPHAIVCFPMTLITLLKIFWLPTIHLSGPLEPQNWDLSSIIQFITFANQRPVPSSSLACVSLPSLMCYVIFSLIQDLLWYMAWKCFC